MKAAVPPELEKCRILTGKMASRMIDGFNGCFVIKHRGKYYILIVSDGGGWEHASVEIEGKNRPPTWDEMCFVKDLIWRDDEAVIQIYPAKANYVNIHPYVLHLWNPVDQTIPLPPLSFV